MTEIFIDVSGADAKKTGQEGILTTGMSGAVVTFRFDSGWDKLTKTAVLRGGGVTKDVLNVGSSVAIPQEVLSQEGFLSIGVEGRSADGTTVIPTVWVHDVFIHAGANASGDASTDPALPVWAQLQAMIGDLSKLDTDTKESLVAAVNEALSKGAVTAEDITKAVNAWLEKNPITVTETDPTVPAWAKQPNKPGYTAAEVGAMPAGTAALPNPHALTFTGAVTGSYDGSEAVAINIPAGGGVSGGSDWECIHSSTLPADADAVSIDRDSEGNDISLREVFFRLTIPKTIVKDTVGFLYVNNKIIRPQQTAKASVGGRLRCYVNAALGDISFGLVKVSSDDATGWLMPTAVLTPGEAVSKIRFSLSASSVSDGAVIPAGATVEVYGRR